MSSNGTKPRSDKAGLATLWNEFWFAPMPAFNFAFFRTVLGLLAFVWFATLAPDFNAFFAQESLAPDPIPGRGVINIFRWFPSDVSLQVGLATALVVSTMLVVGYKSRIAGPILAVLVASFMAENRMLWNAGDNLLQSLCLLFGVYCLLTPSSDLDVSLRRSAQTASSFKVGRIWFLQMVRIQMSIVYLVAFLTKIPGTSWRDGTATMTVFRLTTLERFATPAWLETNYFVANFLTWSSLALEGLLPFLLWNRRTRPYAIVAAVLFHIAIDFALAIGLFSWIMVLGLSTFLNPNFGSTFLQIFRNSPAAHPAHPALQTPTLRALDLYDTRPERPLTTSNTTLNGASNARKKRQCDEH